MTELQQNSVRRSEVRQRLAELGVVDELTDEQRNEIDTLGTEYATLEQRHRALTVAADTADSERNEYRRIVDRADIGEVFESAIAHRATSGAVAELQQHLNLNANQVPLDMLEYRTAGVTPAPTDVGTQQQPIIPAVFPAAVVSWLGIPQDRVGVGEQVYTVISTSATPGTPAKGADQAHSTAGFTTQTLSPSRIQASLFYAREDRARLMGMDESLRMNLSDALADKLDEVVLDNLWTGSTLASNNAGAADDYATYRKRFLYDQIDGTWASVASDCRLLLGADTYGDMSASYRSASSDMNALGALQMESGGVRVSAHAPGTVSHKQNAIVRRGDRRDYAIGLWEGIELITDEVTQAKAGEIVLTAVLLYAQSLLRANGFAKVQAQHA